jgi:transposase
VNTGQLLATDPRTMIPDYFYDLTDAEYALVAPLMPPGLRVGVGRSIDGWKILDANFYELATGCQWTALSKYLALKNISC